MQGKVEISGVNTAKLKTLSNEEMMHLIELAQAGDEQAKQKLVEGNLKLVLSVIQRFMGRGENPDDLFQVGCIGLLKAIANFDTSKQVRFSTYGVPMIAGELRRYLRDYSPIRVSRSVRDTAYRVFFFFFFFFLLTGFLSASRSWSKRTGASRRWRKLPARWTFRWKRSSARWTRLPLRCLFMSRSTPTAETR